MKFEQNFQWDSRVNQMNSKVFTYQEKIEEETESDKQVSEENKAELNHFVGIVSRSHSLASVSEVSEKSREKP